MLSLLALLLLAASPSAPAPAGSGEAFYAPVRDRGAALAADGIYPRGRKLAFMGYSGDPARDLARGFTAAGPVYGEQRSHLERSFAHGWPVVAQIGARGMGEREIAEQVRRLAGHREIVWWALLPEELRPWREDEMRYLAAAASAVRKNDPLARPLYHYNPNHREARWLASIAAHVDILGKGSYVNSNGHKRDRAWVRRNVEQELAAIRAAERPDVVPLLMPELCLDPEPEEDKEIAAWVRHDVYLGLASGAKGVLIWSLFKRPQVSRTWNLWYEAYSRTAGELNGERGLAQVFLFGERRDGLETRAAAGADPASYTVTELAHAASRWLFIVNSANAPAAFTVAGWPEFSRGEDAFNGKPLALEAGVPLQVELPAYGVAGLRFDRAEPDRASAFGPDQR